MIFSDLQSGSDALPSGGRREESAGIELLADLKAILDAKRVDRLTSKEIVEAPHVRDHHATPDVTLLREGT